jgi:transcription-repair coupling factor (superfamily II helicase)
MIKIPYEKDITILLDSPADAPTIAAAVAPPFCYVCRLAVDVPRVREIFVEYEVGDIFITSAEELKRPVPRLPDRRTFAKGEKVGMKTLLKILTDFGYSRVSRIDNPAEFSVRGDVVDVWGFDPHAKTTNTATRVMFFGDEIESVRAINADTFAAMGAADEFTLAPEPTKCPVTTFTDALENLAKEYPIIIFEEQTEMRVWHTAGGEFRSTETIRANLFSERGEFVIPKIDALVYHETRGLGRFMGTKVLDLGGANREYIILQYERRALVYVPATQTEILHNYFGVHRRLDRL